MNTQTYFKSFNEEKTIGSLIRLMWHLYGTGRCEEAYLIVVQWLKDVPDCSEHENLCILAQFFSYANRPDLALQIFKRENSPEISRHAVFLVEEAYAYFLSNQLEVGCAVFRSAMTQSLIHSYLIHCNSSPLTSIPADKFLQDSYDISGKTILVLQDGGHGDVIQHVRYVQSLVEQGASKVYLSIPGGLRALFVENDIKAELVSDWPESYDFVCTSHWLMARYRPEQKTSFPYLTAGTLSEKLEPVVSEIRASLGKVKVAIFWRSSNGNVKNVYRFVELLDLMPVLSIADMEFYSFLKVALTDEEKYWLDYFGVKHFGEQIDDFRDLAVLLNEMDLIITIDSAPLHLAGAMNKPVYALLPKISEWRWGDGTDTTDFYQSVRLFRQDELGNWSQPIDRIADAIDKQFKLE